MQTTSALELVTEDVIEQLARDGVAYGELRFAPLLHTERGLSPEAIVEAVERATARVSTAAGVETRLILCTMRQFTEAQSLATAELVHRFKGSKVVALDLAGDEAGFPVNAHISAYRYAREHGLFRTAHAGEGAGPESVWEVLRLLGPTRIGHGTRSIEDLQLVNHLRNNGIHLELCPTSNVQIIPSIESMDRHPINKLYRAGVPLNINTDSRMLTRTTLSNEYHAVHDTFGWGAAEFLQTNMMALDAAFIEAPVKERLRTTIANAYS